jgi:hypothetical protein
MGRFLLREWGDRRLQSLEQVYTLTVVVAKQLNVRGGFCTHEDIFYNSM